MTSSRPTLRIFGGDEVSQEYTSTRHIPLVTSDKTDPITLELMKLSQYPELNWNYRASALHILRWLQTLIPTAQKADCRVADEIQQNLLRLEGYIEYYSWLTDINTKNTDIYTLIQNELGNYWRKIRTTILRYAPKESHWIPPAPKNTVLLRIQR